MVTGKKKRTKREAPVEKSQKKKKTNIGIFMEKRRCREKYKKRFTLID